MGIRTIHGSFAFESVCCVPCARILGDVSPFALHFEIRSIHHGVHHARVCRVKCGINQQGVATVHTEEDSEHQGNGKSEEALASSHVTFLL